MTGPTFALVIAVSRILEGWVNSIMWSDWPANRRRGLTHCLVAVLSRRVPCVLPPCRRAYTPAIGNSGRLLEEFGVIFRDDVRLRRLRRSPDGHGPVS